MKEKYFVKMFESIPKFDTYSHYNSTLEKVFKSNSLKKLIETLKRQKDFNENALIDQITNTNSKEPIDIYAQEDSDLKKIQNDDDYDIFDENNYEKEPPPIKSAEKTKQEIWRINALEYKRRKFKPNLDPFKYNPNYNSIYKNIPSVKIIDPKRSLSIFDAKLKHKNRKKSKSKEKSKNNENNNSKRKDNIITEGNFTLNKRRNSLLKKIEPNQTPNKRRNLMNTISNLQGPFKSKNENDLHLPKLTRLSKIKNESTTNSDNDNHALRFSKYIPRKYFIPEKSNIVSYIDPINYIKPKNKTRSIDFDKMLHRSEKNMVYASCLKNPSFGQYNPRYNYIEKNETVRLFNPVERNSEMHKKFLMRKLWASYKVNTEYQLVDNSKIKN
jgi:hypothetical protein